jgi:acyl-coenzyme A thioesterase PaaI-like protein
VSGGDGRRHEGPLVHHELCFGCGRSNLFGLLIELERTGEDTVAGRCFVKQDHQGAERGIAHEGLVAAALSEAMSFACGERVRATSLELELPGRAAVGSFLAVEAGVIERTGDEVHARATARADEALVASARGTFTGLT